LASKTLTRRNLPPVRSEQYEEIGETEVSIKRELPYWAANVLCPECQGLMLPIHAKKDKQWGETVVYQCQNRKPYVVVTLTTTVTNIMRPGDFTLSDFDWREVAKQVPTMDQAPEPLSVEFRVKKRPPTPWSKNIAQKIMWETFWDMYFKKGSNGLVNIESLIKVVTDIKGASGQIDTLIQTLPTWMTERTGFATVINREGYYQIIGKTVGGTGYAGLPYSDPEYRKEFGFDE
jgi:hypothetical protein